MTIGDVIAGVLGIAPDAPALEFRERWWTWGDLKAVGDGLEHAMADAGLAPGVRVAGLLRNHPSVAAALLHVVVSRRCMVTLNPSTPDARLCEEIRALRPDALVGLAQDLDRPGIREAADEVGAAVLRLGTEPREAVVAESRGQPSAREVVQRPGVAVEMLTSGTTGVPKRIPLALATLEQAVFDAARFDGGRLEDGPKLRSGVQILNAPFAHISGVFGFFNWLASGRRGCLLERFSVDQWVSAVRRHRPKVAGAPPSALKMILDADVPADDLSSLVAFRTGTAPLDPAVADAFFDRYGIPVLQNYGATEFAGGVAGWTLADFRHFHRTKRGSVGRMNPGVQARIVAADTGAELPRGDTGLLELKARHLGNGDWLRTTDLATLDEDNFLWIKGRADNAIIRGGFKIAPDEVVRAMEQHPRVREAAVVPLPDARLGQVPAAAYLLKGEGSPITPQEWIEFLRERLLPYQVPVSFLPLKEMPRTPSLKVSQPDLQRLLLETSVASTGPASAPTERT